MPATFLKVDAETPESAHGDTEDSPRPAPSAKRANDIAAATTAPAAMLAQDTPDPAEINAEPSVRAIVSKRASVSSASSKGRSLTRGKGSTLAHDMSSS